MTRNGIDVSVYQQHIEWAKVKASGIDFAMVRVGWSNKDGKGGLNIDPMFARNAAECNRLHIPMGVYVYSFDHDSAAAVKTCTDVIAVVQPYEVQFPIAYDMEYEQFNMLCGAHLNTAIMISAMQTIEKAGYYAIMYSSRHFFQRYLLLDLVTAYDKWEAAYTTTDTESVKNGLWQHSCTGKIDGINGNVDLNIAYKNYPAIIAHAKLNNLRED